MPKTFRNEATFSRPKQTPFATETARPQAPFFPEIEGEPIITFQEYKRITGTTCDASPLHPS